MTDLTVCAVLVHGHVNYSAQYIDRLQRMAKRTLPAHRFVVLSDWKPRHLPAGTEILRTTPTGDLFAWWKKLELFAHPELRHGRNVYFDLDTILMRDLDEVAHFDAPFALIPHAGTFEGRNGRAVVKRFNSSVMAWDGDTCRDLYLHWRPAEAKRLWGDQDWIGERMPTAATFPLEWFPRISELQDQEPGQEAKVVLCKKPKNHEAAARWPWARKAWG